jgi:hypothetical protein
MIDEMGKCPICEEHLDFVEHSFMICEWRLSRRYRDDPVMFKLRLEYVRVGNADDEGDLKELFERWCSRNTHRFPASVFATLDRNTGNLGVSLDKQLCILEHAAYFLRAKTFSVTKRSLYALRKLVAQHIIAHCGLEKSSGAAEIRLLMHSS